MADDAGSLGASEKSSRRPSLTPGATTPAALSRRPSLGLKAAVGMVTTSSAIEKAGAPPSSVMVAVRVRPQNAREIAQSEANCIDVGEDGNCIIIKPGEEEKKYTFSFDYSYNDDTDQAIVYEVEQWSASPCAPPPFPLLALTACRQCLVPATSAEPGRAYPAKGLPGVERHHLRIWPDGYRQVLLDDGHTGQARDHPAYERRPLPAGLPHLGGRARARVPRDLLVHGDLQRGEARGSVGGDVFLSSDDDDEMMTVSVRPGKVLD
jgi:hypothetical protein